jgi:hypothetical protein
MPTLEMAPITSLPRDLTEHTGQPAPPYRKLWEKAVQGSLPARQINGRWHYAVADIPAIAASLGMAKAKSLAKSARTVEQHAAA